MEKSDKNVNGIDVKVKQQGRAKLDKKYYASPSLISLGRLSTVTLGGSPGGGDSGNPATFDPPLQ